MPAPTILHVANAAARFALTSPADVVNGWTVIDDDDGSEWLVVDDTQLSTSDGYLQFGTPGGASTAPFPGVSVPGTPTAGFNQVTPVFGAAIPVAVKTIGVSFQIPGGFSLTPPPFNTDVTPQFGAMSPGLAASKQSEGSVAAPTQGQIWPRGNGKA